MRNADLGITTATAALIAVVVSMTSRQCVALESGWGGDSRGMQATLHRLLPGEYPEVPEGGAVWVFAIH